MVRSPERTVEQEAGAGADSRDALDARDLERLGPAQRRQDRREAAGQHRLAHPGRPGEQEVVTARGGDRQRAQNAGMSAHVGEVDVTGLGRRDGRRGIGRRRRRRLATQHRGDLLQARGPEDLKAVDQARLAHVRARDDESGQAGPCRALGHREHAAYRPYLAAERQLAEDRHALERLGGQLAGRRQHAAGDRQVEAGSRLTQRSRSEVDGQAP